MKTRLPIFLLFLLGVTASIKAQGPMSPPARPPVPMTSAQQQQQMLHKDGAKNGSVQANQAPTAPVANVNVIKVPVAVTGRITSGNAMIDGVIREAALTYSVDPVLILSLMRHESSFNAGAVSPKGASGLMQLMPETAMRFGVKNIFDVRENILGGTKYLRWLLDRFNGDVRLALAGYNAGEGAVEFYGNMIPPFYETQNYVRAIYSRYLSLRSGTTVQPPIPPAVTTESKAAEPAKFPTYNQIIIIKASGDNASATKTQ